MSLAKWFASIRERHSSQQFSYERGALITRRLQELLAVPNPTQVETPPSPLADKNDRTQRMDAAGHQ
jgi:hypothetical protein